MSAQVKVKTTTKAIQMTNLPLQTLTKIMLKDGVQLLVQLTGIQPPLKLHLQQVVDGVVVRSLHANGSWFMGYVCALCYGIRWPATSTEL